MSGDLVPNKHVNISTQILDNQSNNVVDYLSSHLSDSTTFRVVSAYFTIQGYDLLADKLDSLQDVKFLFGDPDSLDDLDPDKNEDKRFEIRETGLHPLHSLKQKPLAKRCHDWLSKESVQVRSMVHTNLLHGKMYLTESPTGMAGIVGSSNFTKRGLGSGDLPNIEINLASNNSDTIVQLQTWFDHLWNDQEKTKNVKPDVLDALKRVGSDYSPEIIYYKTLYELFKQEIDDRNTRDKTLKSTSITESQIWNKLYAFQQDGVRNVISKLQKHNGCILADNVGLGKTYTALAVIKYFEQRNERVLVLCPRKLHENWSLYQAINNHKQNPFPEDRFSYTLLAHTDLSRESGKSGSVDLANFNWSNYDLIVIDESHNFRNKAGSRYNKLLDDAFKTGINTKVLMLSATPVNTDLSDLHNQISLMTGGKDNHFNETLDIGNISNVMIAAKKTFNAWASELDNTGNRNKDTLLDKLDSDLFRLLNATSIARSRKHIKQFYADELTRIGAFPNRDKPDNRSPKTDLSEKLSYEELAENINDFHLSLYKPSHYLINKEKIDDLEEKRKKQHFNQLDSEKFLIGMMRTNFLKRLESSAHSLTLTLNRTICKMDILLDKIDRGVKISDSDIQPDDIDDENDDFIISREHISYRFDELDLVQWKQDLKRDRRVLSNVLRQVETVTPDRDGKLVAIMGDIQSKVQNLTYNKDGKPNKKILVFTTFKDTAKYLYKELEGLSTKLNIKMAMVSGDETHTQVGKNNFNEILSNFAPVAHSRSNNEMPEIDLLIATDCLSEGQNLQDCDTVLNYDIHWNPVRLIQRFGRIDRIGSRNSLVRMINYWPTKDMDVYLRLGPRVSSRMAMVDITATGDYDPLDDSHEGQGTTRNFRDAQLLHLMDEIIDLDDDSNEIGLGDFIIEDFLAQLMHYLEKNRARLEQMPRGVYAVTKRDTQTKTGVIFFLNQRNAGSKQNRHVASPVHPYYFVYLYNDGTIRYGCSSAKQILTLFQTLSVGRTEPIQDLCDAFDNSIEHGKNMEQYNKLLDIVISHIRQSNKSRQSRGLGLNGSADFVVPKLSESPRSALDFELITWLVIV